MFEVCLFFWNWLEVRLKKKKKSWPKGPLSLFHRSYDVVGRGVRFLHVENNVKRKYLLGSFGS